MAESPQAGEGVNAKGGGELWFSECRRVSFGVPLGQRWSRGGGLQRHPGWIVIAAIAVHRSLSLSSCFTLAVVVADDSEPGFLLMLFSAGIGIGRLFRGSGAQHAPPAEGIEGQTPEAARFAMNATFLHWGVHGWAVYVLIGLALAYFTYRRSSSAGERIRLF